MDTQREGSQAMTQAETREMCLRPEESKDCWKLRERPRAFPGAFRGSTALLTPSFPTPGSRTVRDCCCLKTASVWHFILTALRNECSVCFLQSCLSSVFFQSGDFSALDFFLVQKSGGLIQGGVLWVLRLIGVGKLENSFQISFFFFCVRLQNKRKQAQLW